MTVPWVVRISGKNLNGDNFVGTGFLVSDQGHIATCRHVVSLADEIQVEFPYSRPRRYQLFADVRKDDLALLQALVPPDPRLPDDAFHFKAAKNLVTGQSVTVFGCSASQYYESPRQLACHITGFSGEFARIGLDGNINAGDSGGLAIAENGDLVGVMQASDPINLGHAMAIPIQLVQEMLRSKGIRPRSLAPNKDDISSSAEIGQALRHNFPRNVTSFIGRESCIVQLKALLSRTSLLTLTGTGGCGKTRLALELGAQVAANYDDGACLVELASLRNADLVANVVASTLEVPEQPGRPLVEAIIDHLANKKFLLVIDNCEHVLYGGDRAGVDQIELGCVPVIQALLRSCAQLSILATSRESLHVPGEIIYRVPSLTVPQSKDSARDLSIEPKSLEQFEAIRLFVDRASLSRQSFVLDARSGELATFICQRLDGIPLAIELAAARVQTMSLEQLADALRRRFGVLSYTGRPTRDKSKTLEGSISWSYDLLAPKEKALLRRLSVFAGGWTLHDAEAVSSGIGIDGWEVLDVTAALVDKSLVMLNENVSDVRYNMLETIREFAWKELDQSGELSRYRTKHLFWCNALAMEAEPNILSGDSQNLWLVRLETNLANIRTALEWCRELHENTALGLQLVGSLWRFWDMHSHFTEGRGWLLENIERNRAQNLVAKAKALYAIGILATRQTDLTSARSYLDEAVAILRRRKSPWNLALALTILGYALRDQGSFEPAARALEEGASLFRSSSSQWGLAFALLLLGSVKLYQGDVDKGVPLIIESQSIASEIKDRWVVGWALYFLGVADVIRGDYTTVTTMMTDSLTVHREIGERWGEAYTTYFIGLMSLYRGDLNDARLNFRFSLTTASQLAARRCCLLNLEGMAGLAIAQRKPERAVVLSAAAVASSAHLGSPLPLWRRSLYDRTIAAAEAEIGCERLAMASCQGNKMTLDQATKYALSDP